jgi:hypothetical protein
MIVHQVARYLLDTPNLPSEFCAAKDNPSILLPIFSSEGQ